MNVRIKATDVAMTQATSRYLDERLAHIEKLLGTDAETVRCEVEVGRDAGRPRHGANIFFAEFTLLRPGRGRMRATNRSESINAAIDDAKAELERQLRNDKRTSRRTAHKSGTLAKRMLRRE